MQKIPSPSNDNGLGCSPGCTIRTLADELGRALAEAARATRQTERVLKKGAWEISESTKRQIEEIEANSRRAQAIAHTIRFD